MFEDNYCYYITRNLQTHPGILIDVAEPAKLQRFMQTMSINLEPTAIFSTHKHWDHTSGNQEMKGVFPNLQIYGGAADNVPGQTEGLQNGRVFEMNDLRITCLHTPCHTRGHMCYYFEPIEGSTDGQEHTVEKLAKPYQVTRTVNRCIFTGDMIFNGGAGLFMEGTPA